MVKVTAYATEVEVEVEVSLADVIDELNSRAEEAPGDRWRAWVDLAAAAIRLLDKAPANALEAMPAKTRDIVVTHLARLIRKWADGVVVDGEMMIATHDRGELPPDPGFYVQAVEPRAIDIHEAAKAIADDLFTNGCGQIGSTLRIASENSYLGGWSKAAVISRVALKLREARK